MTKECFEEVEVNLNGYVKQTVQTSRRRLMTQMQSFVEHQESNM